MTKQLLWQEYAERNRDNHYSYPQLCRYFKDWKRCQQPSMRQSHNAGEKLFIILISKTECLTYRRSRMR